MLRLSREQVRAVDRRAIERYHIPGIVLMENAARAAADEACDLLRNDCVGEVLVLCGGGNNGGDGLAAARHLHNRGADVLIALATDPAHYKGDALINWRIVEAMRLPTFRATVQSISQAPAILVLDAIFGTGLSQRPCEPFDELADAVNHLRRPVLAIDIPSGLDCDTGHPLTPHCIRATRTVTFVAQKTGFAAREAQPYLGEVRIADIGCPRELIEEIAHAPAPA